MSEFNVKVYSHSGKVLRRFVVVGSYAIAMRRGYEAAEAERGAADVVVVRI